MEELQDSQAQTDVLTAEAVDDAGEDGRKDDAVYSTVVSTENSVDSKEKLLKQADSAEWTSGGEPQTQMTGQGIEDALTQIMGEIKKKRQQDLTIIAEVRKEIMTQAEKWCTALEGHMSRMHAARGKELDENIQGLLALIERLKKSEGELDASKTSLVSLCDDMQKGF